MLITDYPDIVRREGLAVRVVDGFATRSHGPFRRNPPAIVWHHDASPEGPSPGVLGWMLSNWNVASANIWVDYQGVWHFVGAGVAWHAGRVRSGMPGSFESVGIETDYTVNETIPWKLYDSLRRGTAAIFRAKGQTSADLHFHKTICEPIGRKVDPWGLDLGTERTAVAELMRGGGLGKPLPLPDQSAPGGAGGADPEESDEDMALIIGGKTAKSQAVVFGDRAIMLADADSAKALREAGVKTAVLADVDYRNILARLGPEGK